MTATLPSLSPVTSPFKARKGSLRGEFRGQNDEALGLELMAVEGGFKIVRREDWTCLVVDMSDEIFEGKRFKRCGSLMVSANRIEYRFNFRGE